VLDEDSTLRARVNETMLDQLEELDDSDRETLRGLITEHVERTGSAVGRRTLDEFDALAGSFVKVFPTDYKRVLAARAAADVDAGELVR
jgi:glutamate synthase domain-containing protein 3